MNRIIFINRFYWPETPATGQLLQDLAESLAVARVAVTVVTRCPPGSERELEHHNGVAIARIRASSLGRRSLVGRSLDFLTFLKGARTYLSSEVAARDVVVSLTDPPLLGTAVQSLVHRRGGCSIQWIQDVFPEIAAVVAGQSALNALRPVRNRTWRGAMYCVTPGEDMAELVRREAGVPSSRVVVSHNWAPRGVHPTDSARWRQKHGLTGKFVVMYSGNLGRVHDFSPLPALAARLQDLHGLTFVFVGDGAQRPELERRIRQEGLRNVLFLPAQPRDALAETLSAGDVHLLTVKTGCESLVFPSKFYGITAVGRPLLVIGPPDCEPARLVRTHDLGGAFSPAQADQTETFLRHLHASSDRLEELSRNASKYGEAHRGPARATQQWLQLLKDAQDT